MRETRDGAPGSRGTEPDGTANGHHAIGFRQDVSRLGRGALREGVAWVGSVVPAADSADADPRPLSRRRSGASGTGHSDGGAFGQPRGTVGGGGFGFDRVVPRDGYAWWYVDAISEDGHNALTVIAFLGSVFSPYYAWARRHGPADPLDHVSINAILYTPRGKRWAMTERGSASLDRAADHIAIGPSRMTAVGGRLLIDIDELTVPVPRRLRGRIAVDLGPVFEARHSLDRNGRHDWRPIAPMAHAKVTFDQPGLSWSGRAYVDANSGSEPLEAGFRRWTWSRQEAGQSTRILYDVQQRDGTSGSLALDYRPDGSIHDFEPEPVQPLATTGWRVARQTRASLASPARVLRTLEDTPFYSRSMLGFGNNGHRAVHESVDLDRFASRWVQVLLPFKMPRRAR